MPSDLSENLSSEITLPILRNVEAPFKLEMLVLIVINEGGDGVVMATSQHSRWSFFLRN